MNIYYVKFSLPVKSGKDSFDSAAFIAENPKQAVPLIENYCGENNSFEIYAEHKLNKDWS